MAKKVIVMDTFTGDIEFSTEVRDGFSLQYCTGEDSGKIHTVGRALNGRYGDKYWIKNWVYQDIVDKILQVHKDRLKKINSNRILFLEDIKFEPKGDSSKIDWAFRIKAAPKDLAEIWGYYYIIESREYWVSRLSDETIAARLYCCLKRIDGMGGLLDFEIMDWQDTYNEFGAGWRDNPNRQVTNILDDDFEWSCAKKAKSQISIIDYNKEKASREYVLNRE